MMNQNDEEVNRVQSTDIDSQTFRIPPLIHYII